MKWTLTRFTKTLPLAGVQLVEAQREKWRKPVSPLFRSAVFFRAAPQLTERVEEASEDVKTMSECGLKI